MILKVSWLYCIQVEQLENQSVICHKTGGVLLQHKKEHQLHCDIKENDNVFYFTTCGWMMWNWLVSSLASKASIVLFDGSPMYKTSDFF